VNTVRDLRCPDGHYECSVFYNTNDGPPTCPEPMHPTCVEATGPVFVEGGSTLACGKPRTTFYATREMEGRAARETVDPTLAGFTSVLYEGRRMSRAELEERKKAFADHQGVPRDSLTFSPMGNKRERADEHRHRGYVNRKRAGFDTQQTKEYQREQDRSTR
jgi:hypothetical protein